MSASADAQACPPQYLNWHGVALRSCPVNTMSCVARRLREEYIVATRWAVLLSLFLPSPKTMSISTGAIRSVYYFGAYLGFLDPSSASYAMLFMPGSTSIPLVGTSYSKTAFNFLSLVEPCILVGIPANFLISSNVHHHEPRPRHLCYWSAFGD
jgi:hypothetical protein